MNRTNLDNPFQPGLKVFVGKGHRVFIVRKTFINCVSVFPCGVKNKDRRDLVSNHRLTRCPDVMQTPAMQRFEHF